MRYWSFIFATITAAAVVSGTANLLRAEPLSPPGARQPAAGESAAFALPATTGSPEARILPDDGMPAQDQAKPEDSSRSEGGPNPQDAAKPLDSTQPPEATRPQDLEKSGPAPAARDAAKIADPAAAASSATAVPAGAPVKPARSAKASSAGKSGPEGIDPEPDVAITPPPPAADAATDGPAADPLANAHAGAVLPALNQAIKTALEKRQAAEIRGIDAGGRRKQRDAITAFYAARDFAPVWSDKGTVLLAAGAVIERLAHARDDALNVPNTPAALKTADGDEETAESDLALSEAVVTYARQATGSRVDPRSISPLIGLKPVIAAAADVLKDVPAAEADAGDKLRAYNPSEPRYAALRKKLMEMRAAHTPAVASRIPAGPDLRVGMSDPRVPLVRARFSLDGTPDGVPQNLRYDTEVAAAVAGFQRANGLPASGVLTKRTIAALSGGQPSRLEGELVANMEMWRWMPRDLGPDRIEVNIPDYQVTVYRDGAPVDAHRVVVGKTGTPTPLFSNAMKYLIVNPFWNVPESIIRKEMMPKMGEGGIRGFNVSYSHGRMVVKQPPGPRNALGRIKFMFPNDYAVYLHDTPSKGLFASKERAFSHGCVRVDQPFRFGASVLGADNGWSEKRLTGMLGNSERYVYLPKPLPVHIEYFTASVDGAGHLALRDDVYDYVHKVAAALGKEG